MVRNMKNQGALDWVRHQGEDNLHCGGSLPATKVAALPKLEEYSTGHLVLARRP
jgi:hypothetical protein